MALPDEILDGRSARRKRQPLPEEVSAYVRGLIISGKVKPGDFIRLEPIAEAVGVSNTPVREGLLALRNEGFVRLVPRRGFVAAPFSPQDVHDLFWAQAQLAGELAARAAVRMTPEELEQLLAVHNAHEQALGEGDLNEVSELGHEFHKVINRAARSYRLALLLSGIVRQVPSEFYVGIEGQLASTSKHHRKLITLMRKHDVEGARAVMTKHVLEGAEHLIARLTRQGVFGAEDDHAAA